MSALRCARCRRVYRGGGAWNVTVRSGVVVGATCPGCLTAEENAEAVVNEAMLTYGRDAQGRLVGHPKAGDAR